MSTPPSQRPTSPTAIFLGPVAAGGGPFALLGLDPGSADDTAILDARDRRMRQIDEHPLAETPEADEVRLSLYAAAAQLLNPSVRGRLAESWATRTPDAVAHAQASPTPRPRPTSLSTHERLLEHDAILALAMFGGWNKRSLRRIASIAHARGMGSGEVASTLRRIGHRRRPRTRAADAAPSAAAVRTPPPSFGQSPPESSPLDEQIDPAQRLLKMAVLVFAVAVVTLVSLVAGVAGLMSLAERGEDPAITTNAEGATPGVERNTTTLPRATTPRRSAPPARSLPEPDALGDPELIVRELDAARRALELTPFEATRRFAGAVDLFASTWAASRPEQRERGLQGVERFLESASRTPDASRLAIDAVGAGLAPLSGSNPGGVTDEQVWPAVWSAGMLARVRSSSVLGSAQRSHADRVLRRASPDVAAIGADFVTGGVAGARLARDALVRAPENDAAWVRWIEAVDALSASDETVRTILITESLDELLATPAGQVGPRTAAIERATLALSWRPGSGARMWLLRTLERQGAESGALSKLISALASRSAAPGIDPTVSLNPNAGLGERRALRTRLEQAWRVDQDAELGTLSKDMRAAMQANIRELSITSDERARLTLAVRLSLLNSSASLARDGALEAASDAIDRAAAIVRWRTPPSSDTDPLGARAPQDGQWAMRYDQAGTDADTRRDLLEGLANRGGGIGPVDAETLVDAAVRSRPRVIQDLARDTLGGFLDAPAVLNALLEGLAEMPRSDDMVTIIELATASPITHDARDPGWRIEARRALVGALIEALARGSDWGGLDDILPDLDDAYALMVSPVAASAGSGTTPPAVESARLLRLRWLREAGRAGPAGLAGLNADVIERRRVARRGLATTPMHEFLAEQLAACESLALLVSSERAGVGGEVGEVLDDLASSQREAAHVASQIAACEAAMARLWMIREGLGR